MSGTPRIFISTTSKGLRSYREAARSIVLKLSPARNPIVQEDFPQHDDAVTIEAKLTRTIENCDAVICLIGHAYGCEPLHPVPGQPRRSYTQMEYFIAKKLGKPVFILLAADNATLDPFDAEDADLSALQQQFKSQFSRSGNDGSRFHDLASFTAAVEHLALPTASQHRPISNLPQRSIGTLFKGREDFMCELRATLTGGGKKAAAIYQPQSSQGARPAAISALGGVGKTRTAIEYGWQFEHEYDALLFVSAATPALLKDNIAALTGPLVLDIQDQCGTDAEKQYTAALRWLHDHPRWFLIIDNVDTEDSLRAVTDVLTRLAHGHVCITTRLSQWPDSVEPLALEVLSDEAGAAYLLEATAGQRAAASDDEAQARALSHRLDGLALALEHAAAYIRKLRLSFRQYQDQLQANAAAVHQWHDDKTVQYPKSVAETWLITFEKLSPEERDLLNLLSWLDPAPIPVWLVAPQSSSLSLHPSSFQLSALAAWHLITWSDDAQTFKVHRLVQEVTRLKLGDEAERNRTLTQALGWLDKAELGTPQDPFTWSHWIPAAPHALRLAEHAGEQQQWQPAVFWRSQVAGLQQFRALFAEAEPLYRSALALAEQHLPPEHDALVTVLNNLAFMLDVTNRPAEAEPVYRRALAIGEKSYGPDHPNVAIDLNNLAELLRTTNRLAEAEPMYRRVLSIFEKNYGLDHPNVATAVNNLAALLYATNRLAEAEPMYRRALAIDEKSLGPDHPDVARDLNNLALLLDTSRGKAEAEPMYRRALAIDEKSLGPDHPDVALDLMNLASVLHELGRSQEALPLIQRAVAIYQRSGETQGYVHPNLANAQAWLKIISGVVGGVPHPNQ